MNGIVIISEILRSQFFSLQSHRFHALAHLVAGVIFESKVKMGIHYLVLITLVFIVDGRFVTSHCFLPLASGAPKRRHRLMVKRVGGALLNEGKSTNMLVHFFGTYAFAASTRFFSCAQCYTLLLKKSFSLFFVLSSYSYICFHAIKEPSSFLPYC